MSQSPIVVALDYDNAADAIALADRLNPSECRLKVGKELFTSSGPAVVEQLMKRDFDVFLDLKFHDIPNTCAKAVKAAAELGVWMVNVHASGGQRMMEAARNELEKYSKPPLLIAVTVLTSMDAQDLQGLGIDSSPQQQVLKLAKLAQQSGMDGVVCSAQEAQSLREQSGNDFCLVTPGIRPVGSAANDQRRIVTPAQALAWGSSYLVIGRPITQAEAPAEACSAIVQDILAAG
ncbi:orotidine-5'-phosphate decarboxylase [uncultured Pseudoteredinibacter sp.]|uniref:orotidine-5'-phosphate decarboxylase n=1 Tax=uncultured Pseudoteredinibacter sp. TaxID=1641701 RepID=UPI00260365F4|nr:orotidine-5'-phosphate decarboxylase [uncultured Pseudoteredinibacter sp.]